MKTAPYFDARSRYQGNKIALDFHSISARFAGRYSVISQQFGKIA
jgi:hypothetical protein